MHTAFSAARRPLDAGRRRDPPLLYSSISLIARGTPPDEWFRLTTLNIPLSVIGGLPFGTLLAGLAMFRYRDTRLNLTALRRAMAAAARVGAAAALPMLGVYGWLFPGFDRANLAVVVKGSSTLYWSELGSDTTDTILWMPGPRWALRGRSIAYGDPFVLAVMDRWPYAPLDEMLVAAHRLPPVEELVRRCIVGEGATGWVGGVLPIL